MVRSLLAGAKAQTRRKVKWPVKIPFPIYGTSPGTIGSSGMYNAFERPKVLLGCPYGKPGDRLWVKETWIDKGASTHWPGDGTETCKQYVGYVADDSCRDVTVSREIFDLELSKAIERQNKYCPPQPTNEDDPDYWKKHDAYKDWLNRQFHIHRPSIFMRRWASRITLEIVSVRVERLQEITEEDAIAEGIESAIPVAGEPPTYRDYQSGSNDPCEWFTNPIDSYRTLWESINGPGSWDANDWVWVLEFKRIGGTN